MEKILFVNACPRPQSRTLELARHLLSRLEGEIEEVKIFEDGPAALNWESLSLRDELIAAKNFEHPMLCHARQFAAADTIVIAAPYWDLMFPAALRAYLESVTVTGLTFRYSSNGTPESLCRAKLLCYVTTAGGYIGQNDFGLSYVKALAHNFFGISDVRSFSAEGLDIYGADVDEIMRLAKAAVSEPFEPSYNKEKTNNA